MSARTGSGIEQPSVNIDTILVFRPILVDYLDPNSILPHLMFRFHLGSAVGNIHEISMRSSQDGMTCMLDAMERLKPEEHGGIAKDFMNSLKKSGNQFIHDVINGVEVLDDKWEVYKMILTCKDFRNIEPLQLMGYLPCLSSNDRERIECTVRNYGNMIGARELFLRLRAKPPATTLGEIEQGLLAIGFEDLSRDIGKSRRLVEELNHEDKSKQTEDCDSNNMSPESGGAVTSPGLPATGATGIRMESPPVGSPREDAGAEGTADDIDDMFQRLSTRPATRANPATGHANQAAVVPTPRPPRMESKSLNLHDYQEELAEPALGGKNTIIVAPTGCGKTRVAIAVAMHVLRNEAECSSRPPKVIFVVNKVALVEQQKNAFQPFVGDVVGVSGDMSSQVPLAEQLLQASVIVLTAQILVNALQDGSFGLSSVGLLILDECHNTQKGNAYNGIMAYYRDLKRENPKKPRPQVVGLTASLGVKKAKRQTDAKDHVLKLCANLDAEEISTVRKHTESLKASYHRPKEETFSVRGRDDNDPFKRVLGGIMEVIENNIFESNEGKEILKTNRELRELSFNRGTQQYEGELSKLARYIPLNVKKPQRARALQDCTCFLEMYNQSLYINRDARTTDALTHINSYIQGLRDKSQHEGGVMPLLIKLFEEKNAELEEICRGETNENPVLKKLEEILEQEYQEKPETLAILFTNTRASTKALEAWMKASQRLCHLNPGTLTGTGKAGGMTQPQQEKLLAMFREKKHKLVISTSVAEEGLDIQMCNLVVRYNYVRDDIGRVQARGRSRAEGGKFYLIFNTHLPHLAERERMNKIRESMMEKATATVENMITSKPEEYKKIVEEFQRNDVSERRLKKSGMIAAKKRKEATRIKSEVKLICKHCKVFCCYADDVKCINGQHHVVMVEEFAARTTCIELGEAKTLTAEATATKEIQCGDCRWKWGYSMIYKGHELSLLSIDSLLIQTSKGELDSVRRWKEVPFEVKAVDLEDLSQRLDVQVEGAASEEGILEKESE